ncbi:MAG: hypothetical protein AMXMBFR33_51450 [Candidatus Xenobia bacterium]
MLNQIDPLNNPLQPAGIGGLPNTAAFGPGAQLGSATARCERCLNTEGKSVQGEMAKARMDPLGEMARDTIRARKAGMRAKLAALQGDALGAAFYGRMSQNAQREMGLNLAANLTAPPMGGIGGFQGLGPNPLLGL